MKRLYYILKVLLGCLIGVFAGSSLYRCWDYAQLPELYAMDSAPWYGQLLVNGVLTAVAALAILLVLFLLKRKKKLPEKNESKSALRRPQARRTLFE